MQTSNLTVPKKITYITYMELFPVGLRSAVSLLDTDQIEKEWHYKIKAPNSAGFNGLECVCSWPEGSLKMTDGLD